MNRNYTHIIHLSDIHFGARVQPEEFRYAFRKVQAFLKTWPHLETTLCVITGDIFHHHAREHADVYTLAMTCLKPLLQTVPTVIMRGNHDIDIHAPEKADAVTAAFAFTSEQETKEKDSFLLLQKSGLFHVGNIVFGNLDVLDATPEHATKALPEVPDGPQIKIALCHATLRHSKFFSHEAYQDTYLSLDVFKGYDLLLLGDVHKRQILPRDGTHLPLAAYPGSLLQLSYGEDPDEHGFAIWDLAQKTVSFVDVPPLIPKLNIVSTHKRELLWKLWRTPRRLQPLPEVSATKKVAVKLHVPASLTTEETAQLRTYVKNLYPAITELIQATIPPSASQNQTQSNTTEDEDALPASIQIHIPDVLEHYQKTHPNDDPKLIRDPLHMLQEEDKDQLREWSKPSSHRSHREVSKKLLELIPKISSASSATREARNYIRFIKLTWSNLSCFGDNNELDLTQPGIYGILGKVYSGKSSILDILSLVLFRRPMRQQDGSRVNSNHFHYFVRKGCTHYKANLTLEVNHRRYEIMRSHKNITRKISAIDTLTDVTDPDNKVSLATTSNEIDKWVEQNLGNMNDMLGSILMSQKNQFSFLHLTPQQQLDQIQEWLQLDHMTTLSEYYTALSRYYEFRQNILHALIQDATDRLKHLPTVSDGDTCEVLEKKLEDALKQQAELREKRDNALSQQHHLNSQKKLLEHAQAPLRMYEALGLNLDPVQKVPKIVRDRTQEIMDKIMLYKEVAASVAHLTRTLEDMPELPEDYDDEAHTNSIQELEEFQSKIQSAIHKTKRELTGYESQLQKHTAVQPDALSSDEISQRMDAVKKTRKSLLATYPKIKDVPHAQRLLKMLQDLQGVQAPSDTHKQKVTKPIVHPDHGNETLIRYEEYCEEKALALKDIPSLETARQMEESHALTGKKRGYEKLLADLLEDFNPKCAKCRARMDTDPDQYQEFIEQIDKELASLPQNPPPLATVQQHIRTAEKYAERDKYWKEQIVRFENVYWAKVEELNSVDVPLDAVSALEAWVHDMVNTTKEEALLKTALTKVEERDRWEKTKQELQTKIQKSKVTLENFQETLAGTQEEMANALRREQQRQVYRLTRELDTKNEELKKLVSSMRILVQSQQMYLQSLEKEVSALEATTSSPIAELDAALHKTESDVAALQASLFTTKSSLQQKQQAEETKQKYEDLSKKFKSYMETCDDMVRYLNKDNEKGYFQDVLASVLPQIAASVNHCLQKIDPLQVFLTMDQGALKIELYDPEKDLRVTKALWSGHQEFIISLCFRIALSSYIGKATYAHMIIDEGWTASDESHLEDLAPIFEVLRNRFESVLLITHLKPVAHQADIVYHIQKEGAWSHISKTTKSL